MGPVSHTVGNTNHPSALQHSQQVNAFVEKELKAGALIGPYDAPPFTPWAHVSLLMTRPKSDPGKRRIITDLSFPSQSSVNAYIMKNSALGEVHDHSLPTVADLVETIISQGNTVHMYTVDIARAYKNFLTDPLDWPLLCVEWDGRHYVEMSMPFGARASSCFMQRVADFITRVLRAEGIDAIMYLDDIVVVAPDAMTALDHYDRVRTLLQELGLPEAVDKTQPPATSVRWLGIIVDTKNMTLSIPQDKLQEVHNAVGRYAKARSINRRQLQSLIGKLVHVAKCVEPARIFISRLLDALRAFGDCPYIKMTDNMRADIAWFQEFMSDWNGVSLIPAAAPHRVI